MAAAEAGLRRRIAEDPWDTTAWESLVTLAGESGNLGKQREVYEALLSQFPTAVCFLHPCIYAF